MTRPDAETPWRALLVDDHQIIRDGLRLCLEADGAVVVAGEAADGLAALERARELRPDLVVLDVDLPGLNGVEVLRELLSQVPAPKVLMLSMYQDSTFAAEMLRAGASGFVSKSSGFLEVRRGVETLREGRKFVCHQIMEAMAGHNPEDDRFRRLSPREREVLGLLARGASAKVTANALGISSATVHVFRSKIREKLGVKSLAELARLATQHGFAAMPQDVGGGGD